jgi:hypothetical protein
MHLNVTKLRRTHRLTSPDHWGGLSKDLLTVATHWTSCMSAVVIARWADCIRVLLERSVRSRGTQQHTLVLPSKSYGGRKVKLRKESKGMG